MGKWRYGVVLDAGSSGTRVHIYRWLNSDAARKGATDAQLHGLPVIETDKKWTKKIHPGVSTFGEHPHDVGPDHLDKLLSHALKHIPPDDVPNTPLFLLATAGMRILPPVQRKEVLKEVCDYARKNTQFQLPDCDVHVQVIPGETEGLYGWIAANYLLGGFDKPQDHAHGKDHSTYGFLDMGGASAQIAFAPNATEAEKHANDLTLMRLRTVDGTPLEHKVFVTTWLGFGVNQARQRYVKALLDSTASKELPDPCLPAGLEVEVTKEGKFIELDSDDEDDDEEEPAAKLHGTGKFQECLHQTFPLLEKEKECLDEPCLLNGQHVPAIDFDVNHFVGVSEYWHTTHEIFEGKHKDKAYDFKTYQERVSEFCNQDWKHIQKGIDKHKWGKKVDEEKAREVCFKASWIINMLHDGIGVPRVGIEPLPDSKNTTAVLDSAKAKGFLDPFQAVNKINDVEVSWTLGKMVLYASSEVPPPDEKALAVGFGSNAPGIPKDFQYPGGSYLPWKHDPLDDDNWHRLFVEYPSRIPALLVFVVIIVVIFGIILGKEKRAAVRKYVVALFKKPGKTHTPLKGKRRGFLPSKLFGLGGSGGQTYERVDAGEDGLSHNDFELEETYLDSSDDDRHFSDDSEGSRVGRTSGWATPQIKKSAEPLTPGYFAAQDVVGAGQALGLAPLNAIERGGLLARTDSRERIRSRASSPKRARSKMGSLDE
ncbi:nucleoside phosphatase family-domain-containing protein [Boeremia exigua]|uniref:nucleoside phosphatase family-domain-containing protein n=1 Tax=Boeremia exigua TaxID=749465 RepID=UPI001E8E465F|nr:nucleoside phosphatase family-domain-containing protein [Boeremia exigua]KAH6614002.1 nucleoside phosphatase family-domain-containing protein [Boeremia exigua]